MSQVDLFACEPLWIKHSEKLNYPGIETVGIPTANKEQWMKTEGLQQQKQHA